MNDFFGPKAPGLHGAVSDGRHPEVRGHIDVSDALIAGTGFLFAPAIISLAERSVRSAPAPTSPRAPAPRRSS